MSNKLYKFYINVEGSIRFQELNIEGSEDNKPSPRCGSSLTMSQTGKLYLIGGADEKCYLSDIWALDTTNGKLCWEKIEVDNFLIGYPPFRLKTFSFFYFCRIKKVVKENSIKIKFRPSRIDPLPLKIVFVSLASAPSCVTRFFEMPYIKFSRKIKFEVDILMEQL